MAVQFWDLYCINNQIGETMDKVWDGQEVKLTFRRNFDSEMLERWFELKEIVSSVVYDQECDALVWAYESKGVYSTQSLYAVINFRGVQPVYIPSVWKINVPPRIQIFLWLLSHNKLMTKDNLLKRGIEKPKECMFCLEEETISHPFFIVLLLKLFGTLFQNFVAFLSLVIQIWLVDG
jgi:hypothetical protein